MAGYEYRTPLQSHLFQVYVTATALVLWDSMYPLWPSNECLVPRLSYKGYTFGMSKPSKDHLCDWELRRSSVLVSTDSADRYSPVECLRSDLS